MSRRTFRRFQRGIPLVQGSRRPTAKELIFVAQTATTSNVETTLKTTTFPCTIVGLRWSIGFTSTTANDHTVNWIIVIVKDGNSANTISQGNGADMYTPEQNVMAFGTVNLMSNAETGGNMNANVQGSTKTMRKLQGGDLLKFISFSNVATSTIINGVVQFFCKS